MRFTSGLILLGLMAVALPASAADHAESEPNDDFPPNFLPGNPLFVNGDRLVGRHTTDDTDLQYIRYAGAGAPGIYRYELNMVEGEDGFIALFDADPNSGWNLSINDDFPGNGVRPRLFFDHFDTTGADTTFGVEVFGFSSEFNYAVKFDRTAVAVDALGNIGTGSSGVGGTILPGRGNWYSFNLVQDGLLTLETDGDVDTELALFDSNGNTIGGDDDGGVGLLSKISTQLKAGTYYVAVGGYNSTYNWDTDAGAPLGWDRNGFGSFTDGFFEDFQTGDFRLNIGLQSVVPEPGSLALLLTGGISVLGLAARRRRR